MEPRRFVSMRQVSDPPLAATARELGALRASVVDAAGVSGAIWFSHLTALFYLLISAGAVTHRDLFLENPVRLPFLNVELPLRGFFWLAPALFVILHMYVLLHFRIFVGKVRAFDGELRRQIADGGTRADLRGQLPTNIFVQVLAGPREVRAGLTGRLLALVAWISLVIAPLALLAFFLVQFLPFQSESIAWFQRALLLVDLFLVCSLWPGLAEPEAGDAVWPAFSRVVDRVVLIGLAALCVALVPLAAFPQEWLYDVLPRSLAPPRTWLFEGEPDIVRGRSTSLLSNRLVLTDFDVIDHTKFDTEAKIEALPVTVSVRGRHLVAARFDRARLRKVDFTGALLDSANFDLADLRGATLGCYSDRLIRRNFLPSDRDEHLCVHLNEAAFFRADLRDVDLSGAEMEHANFAGANMQGTDLQQAHMMSSNLEGAQLQGADLSNADLRNADFIRQLTVFGGPRMQFADLSGAKLEGADLRGAALQGADLSSASLQGASLGGAHLEGALFAWTELQGADFAGSHLDGAEIEGAATWRANLGTVSMGNARLTALIIDNVTYSAPMRTGIQSPWSKKDYAALKESIHDSWQSHLRRLYESQDRYVADLSSIIPVNSDDPDWLQRLDPDKPLPGDDDKRKAWMAASQAALNQTDFVAAQTRALTQAACDPDGAPYAARGMIRSRFNHLNETWPGDARRDIAAAMLRPDCEGTKSLSDEDRAKLTRLANTPPLAPPQTALQLR